MIILPILVIVHLWYLSWKLGCRYFGSQWFCIAFCFRSTLLIKDLIFRWRLASITLTMVFIFWIAPWQNHVTLNSTFNFCLCTRKALIIRFTWRWFYRVSRAWVFVRRFFPADGMNIFLHVVQTKRWIDKHADVDDHHYSNWSEKQQYNILSTDNNRFRLRKKIYVCMYLTTHTHTKTRRVLWSSLKTNMFLHQNQDHGDLKSVLLPEVCYCTHDGHTRLYKSSSKEVPRKPEVHRQRIFASPYI